MKDHPLDPSIKWDVIVIGTGIGGATIGNELAQRGLRVLFLERGGRVSPSELSTEETSPEGRLGAGWWPQPVSYRQPDGSHRRFFAAVGCALGGSSIHYAAALERMEPSDFDGLSADKSQTSPWPITYEELLPYYVAAEKLYRAERSPPEVALARMSEWDRALMDRMRANGLSPEPLNVAIRYDAQCRECIGTVCSRNCKADALSACLDHAMVLPNCSIIERCEVTSLEADAGEVQAVRAVCGGSDLRLRARIVILAAGALHSPQVLLRSASERWPGGLANSSDQVGRNLMFHTSDVIAVWAPRPLDRRAIQKKAVSVRDFYRFEGLRLGYIQSMGLDAGRGVIASYMKDQLRKFGIANEFILSLLVKLPSHVGSVLFGHAGLFAGSSEDDPNPENRITLDEHEPSGASFTYTITPDLQRRADGLYRKFTQGIRPWRATRVSPRLGMNYGHPCGTCRFGSNPATSVLDKDCRTHDIDNLYVVDASFMPRSGAVNPSLTIAANALRVAQHIAIRLGQPVTA